MGNSGLPHSRSSTWMDAIADGWMEGARKISAALPVVFGSCRVATVTLKTLPVYLWTPTILMTSKDGYETHQPNGCGGCTWGLGHCLKLLEHKNEEDPGRGSTCSISSSWVALDIIYLVWQMSGSSANLLEEVALWRCKWILGTPTYTTAGWHLLQPHYATTVG